MSKINVSRIVTDYFRSQSSARQFARTLTALFSTACASLAALSIPAAAAENWASAAASLTGLIALLTSCAMLALMRQTEEDGSGVPEEAARIFESRRAKPQKQQRPSERAKQIRDGFGAGVFSILTAIFALAFLIATLTLENGGGSSHAATGGAMFLRGSLAFGAHICLIHAFFGFADIFVLCIHRRSEAAIPEIL